MPQSRRCGPMTRRAVAQTSGGTLLRWVPPILQQLHGYRPEWLGSDLLAGLSVAAVALPTAIAYPAIVGVPPEVGLYAAIFPTIAYAIFGSSRQLMVGPDSATCLVLASALLYLGVTAPDQRVTVVAALAVITGVLCILAGAARLGFIADFLSRPVLTGFLAGIAVDLIIGQIGRLSGLAIAAKGLFRPIVEALSEIGSLHVITTVVGLGLLVLLRVLRRLAPRFPAPLLAVAIGIGLGVAFDLQSHGVRMVGGISGAVPTLALPVPQNVEPGDLLLAAFSILLVSFGSGIITARSFGARYHVPVDANRELFGFGAANIASGLFGAFPITSSDSRTAVNYMVGGKTQVTGLFAAAALIVITLFAGGILAYLPVAALGAVLASAAVDLIDLPRFALLWRISRVEFCLAITALVGVVVFGVLQGTALAVGASLVHLLWLGSRPRDALLGRRPGESELYKLHHHADAEPIPGLLIYLLQGPLVFFNADYVKGRMLELVDGAQAGDWFVLDGSAINHLDSSAVDALEDVHAELIRRGIAFAVADLHRLPRGTMERSGLADRIGAGMFFHSAEEAAAAFEQRQGR